MKFIIPNSIEKQLKKLDITNNGFLCFLKNNIKWEKIFDQGVKDYFMSEKGKKNARAIDKLLADVK